MRIVSGALLPLIVAFTTSDDVDGCDCATPVQDSLISWCETNYVDLKIKEDDINEQKIYYKNIRPFSGWACSNDPESNHQYLYFQFKNGELKRKIGYFSNGNIDHDFSVLDGKSMGCERMW